ncbi:MAG TPA: hypothetical protein DEB38_07840 [Acidimicrobiaceae bacterium]|nr:hypothetical protein [Acidimicrobiaceae bacterium]
MALSYGFDPVVAVVWLDVPSDSSSTGLCLQHGERLTAPKGWTIDDRRDPTLRLFRPGPIGERAEKPLRRRRRISKATAPQSSLFEADLPSGSRDERPIVESDAQPNESPQTLSPLLSRAFRGTPLFHD